jgi:DNA-directed RNA polymerase alpha subunit
MLDEKSSIVLELPPEFKNQIEQAAVASMRTFNDEVVYRLQKSFEVASEFDRFRTDLQTLREEVQKLKLLDRAELMTMNVDFLGLSGHTHGVLARAGIRTIGELLQLRRGEIKAIDGLGPKAYSEIQEALYSRRLQLPADH